MDGSKQLQAGRVGAVVEKSRALAMGNRSSRQRHLKSSRSFGFYYTPVGGFRAQNAVPG